MAKTREQSQEAREAKLDELHERSTGAVEHLVSGDDWARALVFAARFRARSFSNTLLIWSQHEAAYEAGRVPDPMPSYVASYRQWQGLGRQVEKGQSGYMIFAPVTGRFASSNPAAFDSWRRLGKGEVVRSKMITARPAYVWDAAQTSGDPIPEPPAPRFLEGEAPIGLWDGLAALVEERGFAVLRVPHEGTIHGANGMTDYTAKTVAVRENMDPATQVKTLAHELGHVLMHRPDAENARQHCGIGEQEPVPHPTDLGLLPRRRDLGTGESASRDDRAVTSDHRPGPARTSWLAYQEQRVRDVWSLIENIFNDGDATPTRSPDGDSSPAEQPPHPPS